MKQNIIVMKGRRVGLSQHINATLPSPRPSRGEGGPSGPGEGTHAPTGRTPLHKWLAERNPTPTPPTEETYDIPLALRYRLEITLRVWQIEAVWRLESLAMALRRKCLMWRFRQPKADTLDGLIAGFCALGLLIGVIYELIEKGVL